MDDTPEGRLLQSVRGFVAEMESLKFKERSQRGIRARVEAGRPLPGQKAPFGYRWADDAKTRYELDPIEAPIARQIFDDILAGRSFRSIANDLTLSGIPTPSGRANQWEVATLHYMLKHPIYTGRVVAFRTRTQRNQGKTRSVITPESNWIALPEHVAPRLITEAEYNAIQTRLAHNRAVAPRNNANPEATLLRCGIAKCGYCGHPLSITKRSGGSHMYRCHPVGRTRTGCPSFGILASILDNAVWGKVESVLVDPTIIARELERRSAEDHLQDDQTAIERRAREIDARRARVARAIATLDDNDAAAPLILELKQLSSDAKNIAAELQVRIDQGRNRATEREKLEHLADWCTRVAGRLPSLSYTEKRMILEALGVSVAVYRADHDPRWEIQMAPLPVESNEPDSVGHIVFSRGMPSSMAIRQPIRSRSMG